ncbi:MAG: imidazole glycerol phosphate synthase subunit HisH, partial [Armatimonadetes bacterium]|nr:imidazole glycerol phosphate synthase subunit HisH [Armatimonadota bacterium]
MSIAILDYGVGNLRSVQKALEHVGGKDVVITSEPAVARSADRVILPGVGAFEAAASRLRQSGLDDVVRDTVASGKPLLGI